MQLNAEEQIRQECLQELQQQKQQLSLPKVEEFWTQPNKTEDERSKFIRYRDSIKIACENLENANLKEIAENLKSNESDLKTGCENLQKEINALKNAVTFLNTLSRVISIVDRIIPLASMI